MKAEIRDATGESKREKKAEMRIGKENIPLGSRRWTPLPGGWFLSLESLKPYEGVLAVMAAVWQMCS